MTHDDVLTGYRRRLFTLADEIGVRPACRAMGVHHSTLGSSGFGVPSIREQTGR